MCAGKVYYDLMAERERRGDYSTAIVRFEQLYPLDGESIRGAVDQFDGADFVWVQEEPQNQGAWATISLSLPQLLGRTIDVVARRASASPASGLASRHLEEQANLVARALDS